MGKPNTISYPHKYYVHSKILPRPIKAPTITFFAIGTFALLAAQLATGNQRLAVRIGGGLLWLCSLINHYRSDPLKTKAHFIFTKKTKVISSKQLIKISRSFGYRSNFSEKIKNAPFSEKQCKNKHHVYKQQVASLKRPYSETLIDTRYQPIMKNVLDLKLCLNNKLTIISEKGSFKFLSSNERESHWIPDFGDKNLLFGYNRDRLLAQEERLLCEMPFLLLYRAIFSTQISFKDDEIALIQGVYRRAILDTDKKVKLNTGTKDHPNYQERSLYGDNFQHATTKQIDSCLKVLDKPTPVNVFAIVAPKIPEKKDGKLLKGQPYQSKHIKTLFVRAYTAFKAMREASKTKKLVVHTGNWGCGAFGNNLKLVAFIQIAAAHLAGVDELRYYPYDKKGEDGLSQGATLYDTVMKAKRPQTVKALLKHLETNATKYKLVYGVSNNT